MNIQSKKIRKSSFFQKSLFSHLQKWDFYKYKSFILACVWSAKKYFKTHHGQICWTPETPLLSNTPLSIIHRKYSIAELNRYNHCRVFELQSRVGVVGQGGSQMWVEVWWLVMWFWNTIWRKTPVRKILKQSTIKGTDLKIMLYSNLNLIVNFSVSPHLIMVYVAAF